MDKLEEVDLIHLQKWRDALKDKPRKAVEAGLVDLAKLAQSRTRLVWCGKIALSKIFVFLLVFFHLSQMSLNETKMTLGPVTPL